MPHYVNLNNNLDVPLNHPKLFVPASKQFWPITIVRVSGTDIITTCKHFPGNPAVASLEIFLFERDCD